MGVGPTNQGDNKRAVSAELNLIPFIDLLSVTILFLLMTAVWVEISKMSAFSQAGGKTIVRHSDLSNIREAREDRVWDVIVTEKGAELIIEGRSQGVVKVEDFRQIVQANKEKLESPSEAKIALRASDEVLYDSVIQILDILFSEELQNVNIGGLN